MACRCDLAPDSSSYPFDPYRRETRSWFSWIPPSPGTRCLPTLGEVAEADPAPPSSVVLCDVHEPAALFLEDGLDGFPANAVHFHVAQAVRDSLGHDSHSQALRPQRGSKRNLDHQVSRDDEFADEAPQIVEGQ